MISPVDVLGIGLNATDTLLLLEGFPPYAGKVPFQKEIISPGGQVSTAMVCCAKLGLKAKYIGTVGDDARGRIQRDSLKDTGVDISGLLVREDCPNQTGFILIDISTGERTVLWQRADCLRLAADDINPAEITSARMLHLDGYDTDAAEFASTLAKQHGIPVSLDVDTIYPNFDGVLKNVDYLVASSSWPRNWTGEEDPFVSLPLLSRHYGIKTSAMTLGRYGALAFEDGRWEYSPAFLVDCVDTTGAGDVFHGAFCFAVLTGMALGSALQFANAAAALNCTAIGARGHIPCVAEVNALIKASSQGRIQRQSSPEIVRSFADRNILVADAKR